MSSEVETKDVVVNPVNEKLIGFGLSDAQVSKVIDLGVESVEDLNNITENDLVTIGIPVIKARKIISALVPVKEVVASSGPATANFDTVLPTIPDDTSWLSSLRVGGILKIEASTVIAAVRAGLADKFGFYDVPKKLLVAMEHHIDVTEEQVGEEFYKIRRLLTKKSYGDLFEAIDGLDSSFITETRKRQLLDRLDSDFWPALFQFNEVLNNWQDSYMQGVSNPALLVNAMMAASTGSPMPHGVIQTPDCSIIRDAALSVNDAVNKAFRGTGKQIASALAYEANNIKQLLENSRIPTLCGVPSRDLLLKKIGVSVPAIYPRMESNLSRYVLSVFSADKVPAGNDEIQYFGSLFMLSRDIPWSELRSGRSSSDLSDIRIKR